MIRRVLTCHPKGRHKLYANKDSKIIVFTSESIENIPAGFRARETYKILGPAEFTEVFEIAEPGKEFELYSEAHFRREK
jgi:hypothetical protein